MILDYPEFQMKLYKQTLPNGLRVLVLPRPGFCKKSAYLMVDYGAMHQTFLQDGAEISTPPGVAHYLEHRMFELPDRDVNGEFAALGASVNAFTGTDVTAYYFSCTDHFEDSLRLLLDMVFTSWFPKEAVDRERGIIAQEIGMNEDLPDSRVFDRLLEQLYPEHPVRHPILGTLQTLEAITPEVLERCHRAFYTPENCLLAVVGDVDPEQIFAQAAQVPKGETAAQKITISQLGTILPEACQTMEVAMPTFQLGFRCTPTAQKGRGEVAQEILGDLAAELLFGESSALYLRLYESGLIDSSFGGGFEAMDGCAMLVCGGDSKDPQTLREEILSEAARLVREGVDPKALERAKRGAMGRKLRAMDSFNTLCLRLAAYGLLGFDYPDFPEIYGSVTSAQVESFLGEVVRRENCALSVIRPPEQKEETKNV